MHEDKGQFEANSARVMRMAKISAVGFWTSSNWTGFLMHFVGLLCILPNMSMLFTALSNNSGPGILSPRLVKLYLPLLLVPILSLRNSLPHLGCLAVAVAASSIYAIRRGDIVRAHNQKAF